MLQFIQGVFKGGFVVKMPLKNGTKTSISLPARFTPKRQQQYQNHLCDIAI